MNSSFPVAGRVRDCPCTKARKNCKVRLSQLLLPFTLLPMMSAEIRHSGVGWVQSYGMLAVHTQPHMGCIVSVSCLWNCPPRVLVLGVVCNSFVLTTGFKASAMSTLLLAVIDIHYDFMGAVSRH